MNKIYSCFCFLFIFSAVTIAQKRTKLPCIDKEFSIVAHIVQDSLGNNGISSQQINNLVDQLNPIFDSICVSFKVCDLKYIKNFRYDTIDTLKGQWKELQQLFNVQNRINIYFVDEIKNPSGAQGFADLGSICDTMNGGVVLKKTSTLRTIAHEMGHYFGLLHTFNIGKSGVKELVNGSNCSTEGDGLCDTPADPYVKGSPLTNYIDSKCKFIYSTPDSNGQYFDPLVGNIMSYYPEACDCGFTHEQYLKMAKTYLSNPKMW